MNSQNNTILHLMVDLPAYFMFLFHVPISYSKDFILNNSIMNARPIQDRACTSSLRLPFYLLISHYTRAIQLPQLIRIDHIDINSSI
jgi:hypothetical protein